MSRLLQNWWAQLGWGIFMLVVGIGIGFVAFSALRQPEVAAIGDAVSLTSGGTVKRAGRYNPGARIELAEVRVSEDMPLTATQAAVEGWRDSGACVEGRAVGSAFLVGEYAEVRDFADYVAGLVLTVLS